MDQNLYVIAVEIEENSNLFEVFDYFLLEKNTDMDLRYSENTKPGNYLLDCTGMNNLTLNAYFDGEIFIPDPSNELIDVGDEKDGSKIIAQLYDDKLYGLFAVHKDSPKYIRYEMAMDSKVVCIKNESNLFINLGDIWDGTKFLKPEEA
jgi:hypothetical protein